MSFTAVCEVLLCGVSYLQSLEASICWMVTLYRGEYKPVKSSYKCKARICKRWVQYCSFAPKEKFRDIDERAMCRAASHCGYYRDSNSSNRLPNQNRKSSDNRGKWWQPEKCRLYRLLVLNSIRCKSRCFLTTDLRICFYTCGLQFSSPKHFP